MRDLHGFEAKVVADSITEAGKRLTTLQLRYPRFIHSEFLTHRVFSRNASSSRAIPVAKMIEQVRNDPAMPIHWGKNQPGMQAREEVSDTWFAEQLWRAAANQAADSAEAMNGRGLHKQVVNRILEAYQWMHVVVTATEWDNFFALRMHPDAEPNIEHLAKLMKQAMDSSLPLTLKPDEWHLPYVDWNMGRSQQFVSVENGVERLVDLETAIKCSVARCARVSYLTHDGQTPSIEKDVELYDRLVGSEPMHASPAEHQASPDRKVFDMGDDLGWCQPNYHGNLEGWCQFRKLLEHGHVQEFIYAR